MINDFDGNYKSLSWGITNKEIAQYFPNNFFTFTKDSILICGVGISPFPSDCGCLIVRHAQNADLGTISVIEDIASLCGFNKIICTLVGYNKYIKPAVSRYRNKGFRCVCRGKSNRSPTKDSYIMVKQLNECMYKGY